MDRRKFLSLTGTYTGGALLLPHFLQAFGMQNRSLGDFENQSVIFIQLNGGNDGLNTFIPYNDPLYYALRPKISITKDAIIGKNNGMGFHPALKGLAQIQQNGHLNIIQNVGYPNPNRSHFRSQEIWQTASSSNEYLTKGWLGRYLDVQCNNVIQPTAGVNFDSIDTLALKGENPNSITLKNPNKFRSRSAISKTDFAHNPQLDFVLKVAQSAQEGTEEIQKAIQKSKDDASYPKTKLAAKLKWISKLIKGNLNSKVYYTSTSGFDTHNNQLPLHNRKLTELNDAVFAFYTDLVQANAFKNTTIVIFSEFGRRVADNGNGTDHGKAAPMFILNGKGNGNIIGNNPNLKNLDNGDLKWETDFRSVYASILKQQLNFDPKNIGIHNAPLAGLL